MNGCAGCKQESLSQSVACSGVSPRSLPIPPRANERGACVCACVCVCTVCVWVCARGTQLVRVITHNSGRCAKGQDVQYTTWGVRVEWTDSLCSTCVLVCEAGMGV